jgi:hypothetical protein
MKRAVTASLVAALTLPGVFAQGRDFSGRWVVDVAKTAVANPNGTPAGNNLTITMDAKTMTVLSTTRYGLIKDVYHLDGSESKNDTAASVGPGGGAPRPLISTAKWEGDVLVVTTKLYSSDATEQYSLDGTNLKVEFANPQMTPPTRIVIYKRGQ